ncbi:hypothetical protein [Streptomyces lydicus]|uniref:hypothetical protein n=1 Tax=Streptomyces lydicus TaxID=47763 RepID=UPI003679BB52
MTKAADAARERTTQHLLATRLEQLREPAAARTETAAAAPWTGTGCPSSPRARWTPKRRPGR